MPSLKAVLLCVFLLSALAGLEAQTLPEWQWAVQAGGSEYDEGYGIAVDNQGNQFVTGSFGYSSGGTASFGDHILTSNGGDDIFICKLDPGGNFLWAKQAGGATYDRGIDIAVDSAGNSYVTGMFLGTANFGDTTLTSNGGWDIFICKLDSDGDFLWAKQAGGTETETCKSIAVDSQGNPYITGEFVYTASFGDHILTSNGGDDIFICKLDPAGNFLWAKQAGGTSAAGGSSIAVDNDGNIYVTGYFWGISYFDAYTLTSGGVRDIFICKLDSEGNFLWAERAGGPDDEYCHSIAADIQGNQYVTGYFRGTASFGDSSLTSNGSNDIFVAKLDSAGNFLWAKQAGGTSNESGDSVTVDSAGNSYITGIFLGTANFGDTTLTSNGGWDIFICKLDSEGNFLWAERAGGTEYEDCGSIAVDGQGNQYMIGYFEGTTSFGSSTMTSIGLRDIFVARFSLPTPTFTADFCTDITYGPEPFTVQFTDLSSAGEYPINIWLWIFGDGGTSTEQNPVHTYTSPGVYTVSLTVIDQNYQTDTQVQPYYITVIERVETVELNTAETLFFGSVYLEEQSGYQLVSFSNTGNVDLTLSEAHFLAEPLHFELSEPFTGMILPPGESGSLMVRFSPQAVGALYDTLFIVNNSSNLPVLKVKLSGTGLYVPPKAPLNVNVTMDGDHAVITWDAVTQNTHDQPLTPDYYFIFNSSDPYGVFGYHGSASGLQYIHPMVGAFQPRMFYRVVAYKYYRRGAGDLTALKPGMSEAEVWRVLGR